jgi:hypothetical protein
MTAVEWFEEGPPADLEELLDQPMVESGATRFEIVLGELIEHSDPALGVALYDGRYSYIRTRDVDDEGVVLAQVFERETGSVVAELRVAWNTFFASWVELIRRDLLEAAANECLRNQAPHARAELAALIPDRVIDLREDERDPDYVVLSLEGADFGRVHRSRLIARVSL